MEVLNHSPATWHGERLGLGMAWAVLTSPWRSCLPGLCSCDRECSRISTCMGPSGPYIHHQEPSIFLSLSHSSFSEPSGRSASTDYIHLSFLVNPGLCCFLNQSGIDTDSGWGPGHPFWRAVGVTGLWLKWIYDLHPIYCSRYKDHPQDPLPRASWKLSNIGCHWLSREWTLVWKHNHDGSQLCSSFLLWLEVLGGLGGTSQAPWDVF